MRAMILDSLGQPLRHADVATPRPGAGQPLIRVRDCALCRIDLHAVDGELAQPKLPLIAGDAISPVAIIHESVGKGERR